MIDSQSMTRECHANCNKGCVVMRDTTRGNEAKQRDCLKGNNYSKTYFNLKKVKVVFNRYSFTSKMLSKARRILKASAPEGKT